MEKTELIWCQSPEIWAAGITWLGITISGIAGWLFFKRKNKILTDFQKEVEGYKAELEKQRTKASVEYSLLQGKRIEITHQLYGSLTECQKAVSRLLMPEKPKEWDINNLKEEFSSSFDNFMKLWVKNRIYYSKAFADELDRQTYNMVQTGNSYIRSEQSQEDKIYYTDSLNIQRINNIKLAVDMIADEFRKLIGVEN